MRYLDSAITLVFSLLILISTRDLVKTLYCVLMEKAPNHLTPEIIASKLRCISDIREIKDLHVWSLNLRVTLMTAKIICDDPEKTLKEAKMILDHFAITHSTLEVSKS